MELTYYLRAIGRRWPIIVILPVLVGALAAYQLAVRDATYTSALRAVVTRHPDPAVPNEYQFDAYYNYLSSEFAIDDMVEATRGNVFAEAVAQRASAEGTELSTGEVQAAISSERRHRVLNVRATSQDPTRAAAIASAAAAEIEERAFSYLGMEQAGSTAVVQIIDQPGAAGRDTGRMQLLLLLQVIAAAGVGFLIAMLVDYLDDTLHDPDAASVATGLPLLASVQRDRRT